MRIWSAQDLAARAGASLLRGGGSASSSSHAEPEPEPGPGGASIDSRRVGGGELFVGLRGERHDGSEHWRAALAAGAWGVLVTEAHAREAASGADGGQVVLAHEDPLAALHALARAWRELLRSRGAKVLAITGSTGKTSTKDILAALLGATGLRTVASPQNSNTEIGLPLAVLDAAPDTEALVLEMAMRGAGQIAELTEIADPDVGIVVNIGPAHLELLGSVEAIAAAKAELIAGMRAGAVAVVPAGERLLEAHLRQDLRTLTFGQGGDVSLAAIEPDVRVVVDACGERLELEPSFGQAHNLSNLLAAAAGAVAVGARPRGAIEVEFSAMRGQRVQLTGGIVLIEDCYNANPMSMRAALDDLASGPGRRRVAVLGDMLELGPSGPALHRDVARHAVECGVGLLVTVGPLAREMASAFEGEAVSVDDAQAAAELMPGLLGGGEAVLVKGSRGVGLEKVAAALKEAFPPVVSGGNVEGRPLTTGHR